MKNGFPDAHHQHCIFAFGFTGGRNTRLLLAGAGLGDFQSYVLPRSENYGYDKEAAELAEKTITLFGKDLEACGELHEYYDPDTGEGVNNPGFQCWNLLVNNMIAEEEGRKAIREF